jgi:hypothetical protein
MGVAMPGIASRRCLEAELLRTPDLGALAAGDGLQQVKFVARKREVEFGVDAILGYPACGKAAAAQLQRRAAAAPGKRPARFGEQCERTRSMSPVEGYSL